MKDPKANKFNEHLQRNWHNRPTKFPIILNEKDNNMPSVALIWLVKIGGELKELSAGFFFYKKRK